MWNTSKKMETFEAVSLIKNTLIITYRELFIIFVLRKRGEVYD
jgi:hypothetical protein